MGRLSDVYGRKGFYVAGTAVFLIGSMLSGLSQTIDQLIVFRAVQGLGGGVMMALAFVTVGDLFPPAERGKYQGVVAAVFGLSSVIGPTLGGAITDNLSWHWIFYVNLPLGLPILALFIRFFPQTQRGATRFKLDVMGMALLVLAIVPLMVGLSIGGVQYEWGSVQVVGVLLFAGIMVATLVYIEFRAEDPIMALEIYRNRVVVLSLVATLATGFAMFGAIIFIPLFFQGVLGASATSSGSFLTPMMLGVVVGATLSGQTLSRLGGHYRAQGLIGLAIMATGLGLVSQMTADTGYGRAVANIVVMGFGLGTTFPTFTIAVQNAVPHRLLGVVTSATQCYRAIGGALGLAILGSVMANRFSSGISESLSSEAKRALTPEGLADMAQNPQALMNPDALAVLQARFADYGPRGPELAQQMLATVRETLASAIGDVLVIGALVLVFAFVATAFLREVPLRKI